MSECEFQLAKGRKCGQPAHKHLMNHCPFHALGTVKTADFQTLKDYVTQLPQEAPIDLSNMTFDGFLFGGEFSELLRAESHRKLIIVKSSFVSCRFDQVHFDNGSYFELCQFTNSRFVSCTLDNRNFVALHCQFDFGHEPQFDVCTFHGGEAVEIVDCRFLGQTQPMKYCMFRAPLVSFKDCDFDTPRFYSKILQENDFDYYDHRCLTISAGTVRFDGMKVNGHFQIQSGPNWEKTTVHCTLPDEKAPILDFQFVNFSQMKTATFIQANLSRARFNHAILSGINDVNSHWPSKDDRRILYEDKDRSYGVEEKELRRLYSSLKKLYEDSRDYVRSDHWFYREMECRKQMALTYEGERKWNAVNAFFTRLVIRLYSWTSEYGENYPRVLLWVMGVCIVFAPFYMLTGFKAGQQEVQYVLLGDGPYMSWHHVCDFFRAVGFSLSAMAAQVGRNSFTSTSACTGVVSTIQLVLSAISVTLFLLAVRRKFRR